MKAQDRVKILATGETGTVFYVWSGSFYDHEQVDVVHDQGDLFREVNVQHHSPEDLEVL